MASRVRRVSFSGASVAPFPRYHDGVIQGAPNRPDPCASIPLTTLPGGVNGELLDRFISDEAQPSPTARTMVTIE
jgi:hypothetical protein